MTIENLINQLSAYPDHYEVYVSEKNMLEIGQESAEKFIIERIININNEE